MARYLGSVYKRKGSPYYWGQVMVQGKRIQRSFTRNKATSLEQFRKWRIDVKDNRGSKGWEWYKKWFISTFLVDKKENTRYRYLKSISRVEEIIAPKELQDFTPENLAKFRLELRDDAIKRKKEMNGVNKCMMNIKTMLIMAMDNNFAHDIKIKVLKNFPIEPKPLKIYPIWELAIINHYASPVYKAAVMLMARAGLRPEEPINLLKTDIDWVDKSGKIQPHAAGKNITAWMPKKKVLRNFTIEDKFLFKAMQELPLSNKSPYLLNTKYDEPFGSTGALYHDWQDECQRINDLVAKDYKIPARKAAFKKLLGERFTDKPYKLQGDLKSLRKTFSTQLEECELVKEADIRFLLGHRPKTIADAHYFVKRFDQKRHLVKYLQDIPLIV